MDASKSILGSGRTDSVSSRPFRALPAGGGLLVPYSLSRSPAIENANGSYGAWPGWAVSISVLPLTTRTEHLQFNNVELKIISRLENYKIKFLKIFRALRILHSNP